MGKGKLTKKDVELIARTEKYFNSIRCIIRRWVLIIGVIFFIMNSIVEYHKMSSLKDVVDRLYYRSLLYQSLCFVMYCLCFLLLEMESKKWLKIVDKLMEE